MQHAFAEIRASWNGKICSLNQRVANLHMIQLIKKKIHWLWHLTCCQETVNTCWSHKGVSHNVKEACWNQRKHNRKEPLASHTQQEQWERKERLCCKHVWWQTQTIRLGWGASHHVPPHWAENCFEYYLFKSQRFCTAFFKVKGLRRNGLKNNNPNDETMQWSDERPRQPFSQIQSCFRGLKRPELKGVVWPEFMHEQTVVTV